MVKNPRSYNGLLSLSTIVLSGATIISGILLSSSGVSADSATASVTVGSACTMTATVNTAHSTEISPGASQTGIGSTTLNTICNDAGGFAIYAVGYTGNVYGNNKMSNGADEFNTGTGTSASNWNMSLSQVTTGTYATTIDGSFGSYSAIPSTFTKVAHRDSATDSTSTNPPTGSSISLTYGAYISTTQAPGEYVGKVKFTLVHPATEIPAQPIACPSGRICYYPNSNNAEGTMGRQSLSSLDESKRLIASNFSRNGYGFAGWSASYDYSGDYYGPNDVIAFDAGKYFYPNPGLSLYAVWVKSAGSLQSDADSICSNLTQAPDNGRGTIASVSALTDERDGQTYAIAKLADGNCWMIENLRLDNTAILTTTNTNNPSNDGTNVTLKHNSNDTTTYNTLSATSSTAYDEINAPEGWCVEETAECINQSRLRTINTSNRAAFDNDTLMDGQTNLYSYGNYYNFYSATAGKGSFATERFGNTSVDGDICPIGWKLPTKTEFSNLKNIINPNSSSTSSGARIFPNNMVFSGMVQADHTWYLGDQAHYAYSSHENSVQSPHTWWGATIRSDSFYSAATHNQYHGMTIRCLAKTNP